jgi:hypothetical protein
LNDFEKKYGFTLQYDTALVANYRYDYLYLDTERQWAFDIIFREIKDLSYYIDENNIYRIVLTKNLPQNRTRIENKRYEGKAGRHNLTVTGRIKDQTNGEFLPFATVHLESNPAIATTTNTEGYFTLYNVPSDTETLVFKYLGYETQYFHLSPEIRVENLFVELQPAVNALDEVVIIKEREDILKIPKQSIGVIQSTAAKIADLPALGEKDLFRAFQLMPGISAANESSAGMYVRGGTPDQNLILYDGFTIYHQEHLMGVFSAFNTNAVKDVQLHKGGNYETKDYLFDVEAYYKRLYNLSEYTLRFAPSFIDNSGYQEFFYNGSGYSRGMDFLLQKKYGKLTGWIGYTLSETRYHFPVYGNGYFPANQDVTHEFKTVCTYKPRRDLTLSATWIYATGKPFTEPIGAYTLSTPNGGEMNCIVVGKKNNARYPAYHRLDLLAKYDLSFIRQVKSSLSVSLFNVYDRTNVWYKEYAYDKAVGVTETNINLLGFTPNVTLSIQLK